MCAEVPGVPGHTRQANEVTLALPSELMVSRALQAWPFPASDSPGLCRALAEREVVLKEQKQQQRWFCGPGYTRQPAG